MSHDYESIREARWRYAQVNPHNERLRAEKLARQAKKHPPLPFDPGRLCNACGKPSQFDRTNPGLTDKVWCEPCYRLAVQKLDDDERFRLMGRRHDKSHRHRLHNESIARQAAERRKAHGG